MISFSDPGASIFLANLSRVEKANEKTQEDISSGVTIRQPEDEPDQVSPLLQLESSLSLNTQVQTNLNNVLTSANAADQALTSTLQLADQATSLGSQGASSITTAETRQQLAQQVEAIFTQVLSRCRRSNSLPSSRLIVCRRSSLRRYFVAKIRLRS